MQDPVLLAHDVGSPEPVAGRRRRRLRPGGAGSAVLAGVLSAILLLALGGPAEANDPDVAEMRRALNELQAQNRQLLRRLEALEGRVPAAEPRPARRPRPDAAAEPAPGMAAAPSGPWSAPGAVLAAPSVPLSRPPGLDAREGGPGPGALAGRGGEPLDGSGQLAERVLRLEMSRAAQETATRSIIRDALTSLSPNINSYIALGGAVDIQASRSRDYFGPNRQNVSLTTAEFDFDIKINEWIFGSVILGWDPGTGTQFQTSDGSRQGVDRFTLDRATIAIGDPQRFPLIFRAGRDVVNFGTSTGIARLDTLSLAGPLTTDAFESRQTFFGFEFAFPTPQLGPLPPPVAIPPVRPLVLNPMMGWMARSMGYQAIPRRLPPLVAGRPPPVSPPFYGSLYVFQGDPELGPDRGFTQNINASLGYITQGYCGRSLEESRNSLFCPWSFDIHVDYISSIFDSGFFRSSYRSFLGQIGEVPGLSASVKASAGPFALVAEYNTAIADAVFIDDTGRRFRLRPSAWQASLAYQFDWNPWIEKVGEQGNYISVMYSGTSDLAGANQSVNGVPTRVGFLPRSRLSLTAGEWFFPGIRLAVEFTQNWDYSKAAGGTGRSASGIFTSLLLTF